VEAISIADEGIDAGAIVKLGPASPGCRQAAR